MNTERERENQDKGKAYPKNDGGNKTEKDRHAPGRDGQHKAEKASDGKKAAR
ncbi:MAG: hypothetical protein JJU27_04615 [Gammaproteobacteria bacterium]|nr:hypothetical protein [Gammaproteobacteria bacterium]